MEVVAPVLRKFGEPQVLEEISLASPQQGEVRVRMVAAGICHSCLSVADGSMGELPLPMILGDEGAGIVDAVGPGCRSVEQGDHVIISWAPRCGDCRYCTAGRPGLCVQPPPVGCMRDGTTRFRFKDEPVFHLGPSTYSPYIVIDESAAVKITRAIRLEKAALIGCAVTTGVGAVLNTAGVRAGESVAVFGCGGVGQNAVQGAALAGANPIIAVDLIDEKLVLAEKLGATCSISGADNDLVDWILRISHGGVDHAIVAVGSGRVAEQAIQVLGPSGTCVLVGAPPVGEKIRVDCLEMLSGERRIIGSRYGSSNPATAFPRLVDLHLAGKLKLDELITRRYRPDEVNVASAALIDGRDVRGLLIFDDKN